MVHALLMDWRNWARPDQRPPEGVAWRSWLILGGRGCGKTRTGAEWVKAMALGLWQNRATRIAIVAPTFAEARLVMIEGTSGLLAVHGDGERPRYEPSKRQLTWPNGSVAHVFSAEEPDGLRGPQFDAVWCDELAKWRRPSEVWDMFTSAPDIQWAPAALSAANAAKDGTGTVATVFAADAINGGFITKLNARPSGTAVATVLRVFINNGASSATPANNILFAEMSLPAVTLSEIAAQPDFVLPLNIALPANYKILCSLGTAVAAGYYLSVIGGKY